MWWVSRIALLLQEPVVGQRALPRSPAFLSLRRNRAPRTSTTSSANAVPPKIRRVEREAGSQAAGLFDEAFAASGFRVG